MLKILLGLLVALTLAACETPSAASPLRLHGPPNFCAYGSAFDDGCAAADKGASFTVFDYYGTSLYGLAATSGQTWTSPHPQPFNLAAVNYPIGPNKNVSFKDWLTTAIGSGATAGCALEAPGSSTGNPFNKVVTTGSALSGTTLTIGSITSGTPYPGLFVGGAGIPTTGANVPVVVSGSGLVWTVTNPGNLNIGAESMWLGGPRIACSSGTPTFDGWDFSTHGGGQIRVTGSNMTVTVKNSKTFNGYNTNFTSSYFIASAVGTNNSHLDFENNFSDGANVSCTLIASYAGSALTVTSVGTCDPVMQINKGSLIGGGTMTANTTMAIPCVLSGGAANCTLTGNGATGGPSTIKVGSASWEGPIVWDSTNCNITVKYNAFVNEPITNGAWFGTNCTIHVNYNFAPNMDLNTLDAAHTAYFVTAPSSANVNIALLDYSYNTCIYPSNGAGHGSTCFSILGSTGLYTTYTNATIVGNTGISNLLSGGGTSNSTALFFLNDVAGITGTLTIHDNWVDPTGAFTCISNLGDMTGNAFVDDGLGSGAYDGVPGNTVTVTGVTRGKVYVGSQFGPIAGAYGAIQPYNTGGTSGTGTTGTYIIDGPPHASPTGTASSYKTFDTPITTLGGTLVTGPAGQVGTNMRDGTPIVISGTQWNQGACNGHQ